MRLTFFTPIVIAVVFCVCAFVGRQNVTTAAEIVRLDESNWDEFVPKGKEVDAIYGDIVMRSERVICVIANPIATRNANMTVKGIGGCLIDLTRTPYPNDQLSCWYPTGRKFQFRSEDKLKTMIGGEDLKLERDSASGTFVAVSVTSTSGPDGLKATVTYTLDDANNFLAVTTKVENATDKDVGYELIDEMRADKTFKFGSSYENKVAWAYDQTFRQAYAVWADGYFVVPKKGRGLTTSYFKADEQKEGKARVTIKAGESFSFERKIAASGSHFHALGIVGQAIGEKLRKVEMTVADSAGPISGAIVTINRDGKAHAMGHTGGKGIFNGVLPPGVYTVDFTAIGRPKVSEEISADGPTTLKVELARPGFVKASINNEAGKPVPSKVSFYGVDGTKDPDYGHEALANACENTRYSMGRFVQPIGPGKYEAVVSRGPEFDAAVIPIEVKAGETTKLAATLKRVVDTKGFVSTEYHSHSSPSGDNNSDQFGRVQNLLAEHIEFAPCTEHNRIDSYMPHLKRLKAEKLMATCTGMELTGALLPVNHQNVFPLIHKPRTQDGGGPVVDSNPVVQIERIAMWDNGSDKLVQTNHPNLAQIYGDRDLDKKPDEGFRKMFGFMDVMEVHPLQTIFNVPGDGVKLGSRGNTIFNWMQLLNQGYRIPGVVNTDAHYNFHGSGWLRNYVKSNTDDPAEIKTMDMVHASEKGNLIMTTGPYMTVSFMSTHKDDTSTGGAGDDVKAFGGKGVLHVQVQCPNWLDVNRVQVFVNGRMDNELNFTRRENAEKFSNDVVKFNQMIPITLKEDSHLIVAAIGEGLKLGRVMGPSRGNLPPVVVSNPIFADVDANGFKPNGDLLDGELPGAPQIEHSHDHEHDHDHPDHRPKGAPAS